MESKQAQPRGALPLTWDPEEQACQQEPGPVGWATGLSWWGSRVPCSLPLLPPALQAEQTKLSHPTPPVQMDDLWVGRQAGVRR